MTNPKQPSSPPTDRDIALNDHAYYLADAARYDLASGVHTRAACVARCGRSARGGGLCWVCAARELATLAEEWAAGHPAKPTRAANPTTTTPAGTTTGNGGG